jgi:hypothetical protein
LLIDKQNITDNQKVNIAFMGWHKGDWNISSLLNFFYFIEHLAINIDFFVYFSEDFM